MATSIVLLADDLTGALDSAAPFVARGLDVRIAVGLEGLGPAMLHAPDVLVVDTASRALPAPAATQRIEAIWRALGPLAPRIVIKKVDSRLRGHVAAETRALMSASGRTSAVLCPAIPEQARFVQAGHVHGRGIAEPIAIAARFAGVVADAISDAVTPADLDAVARIVLADPSRVLAVGARGLAAAIAAQFGTEQAANHASPALPMILAIGSRDPITAAQLDRMRAERLIAPAAGPVLLVRADEADTGEEPAAVASRLADRVVAQAEASGARTILAIGGDTASAVLRALGATVLVPQCECAPGVPVAAIAEHAGLTLVTKSGGFGAPDTLAKIVRAALVHARQVAA